MQQIVKAGTIVKINGFPYTLPINAVLDGENPIDGAQVIENAKPHIGPTYFVGHPDGSFSVADPQPHLPPVHTGEYPEGTLDERAS